MKSINRHERKGLALTVSFVNMPPEEDLVATVKQVAARHALRNIASRVERLASGLYRVTVSADGRGAHFAHHEARFALLGALAGVLLDLTG